MQTNKEGSQLYRTQVTMLISALLNEDMFRSIFLIATIQKKSASYKCTPMGILQICYMY